MTCKALEALPDPDKLELLARWLDLDDVTLRREVTGEPLVQDDLREWARLAREAKARAKNPWAGREVVVAAESECDDECGTDCPCFQAGYEAPREPLGGRA